MHPKRALTANSSNTPLAHEECVGVRFRRQPSVSRLQVNVYALLTPLLTD